MLGFSVTLGMTSSVVAQDVYPNKLVRIVIPFSAGGSSDLLTRNLADKLSILWKQPVIVENRAGASGIIGTDYVAKQKNDGYTLLIGTQTTHSVVQSLYPKLPYDPHKDFTAISELVNSPLMLSVHPDVPVKTLQEFITYAKANPGNVTYGGSLGSTLHLPMEMLASRAGVKMQLIPYKGSGPIMIDLMSGTLNASLDAVITSLPLQQKGKIRTLAVTSKQRSPLAPQIPTIAEQGFPGYDASIWWGLFAPAGTPEHIVKKINEDTRKVLNDPVVRSKLEASAMEIIASSPQAFKVRVKEEEEKWRKVIVDNNIKVD